MKAYGTTFRTLVLLVYLPAPLHLMSKAMKRRAWSGVKFAVSLAIKNDMLSSGRIHGRGLELHIVHNSRQAQALVTGKYRRQGVFPRLQILTITER